MSNIHNIKIALADDHNLIRSSVAKLVASFPNCTVLFEAENGAEVLSYLKQHIIPDILLLDIDMPVMDGFETALAISKNYPLVRILTLTMSNDERSIVKMLRNGATGYISKNIQPHTLQQAIEAMAEKNHFLPEDISTKLISGLQNDIHQPFSINMLNEREIEFLKYVPTDLSYPDIALKMNVSHRTVDDYRTALFTKLKVKTRMGLAVYAMRNQIYEP